MRISDWSSDVCSSDLDRKDFSQRSLPLATRQGTESKGQAGPRRKDRADRYGQEQIGEHLRALGHLKTGSRGPGLLQKCAQRTSNHALSQVLAVVGAGCLIHACEFITVGCQIKNGG